MVAGGGGLRLSEAGGLLLHISGLLLLLRRLRLRIILLLRVRLQRLRLRLLLRVG